MASPTVPGYDDLIQIGKGGFSRVYRAEQAKFKRGVAVKVLNFGLNDEADRRSFERECELMGRVSTHPNIVTVYDTAFTVDGQPCIVMEHYPGGSLADLIGQVHRLSVKEALEVGVSIAGALEASHRAGVLHCDLKPQNILISEFGQPALGDFGISTFAEERTRTGGDAGFTLAYAAPEIVEGASPSVESDLYSLGATLYTALAGRRPFSYFDADGVKPSAAVQARRILLEEPASLSEIGVPLEITQLIRAVMAKEPGSRPSSAAGFARALHEVGQRLGLGTSSPRIATDGALSGLDSRPGFAEPDVGAARVPTAEVEPAAMPAPMAAALASAPAAVQPLKDATELRADGDTVARSERADDHTSLRVDVHEPVSDRSPRRFMSVVIGVASLVAVAVLLVVMTRGGTEESATTTPVPVVRAPQAEVLLAPPPPTDVAVRRVGGSRVLVSWSNDVSDDITYEVHADDTDVRPTTAQSAMLFEQISPNDLTCYEVIAIRGNRLKRATERVCTSPLGANYVEASPAVCDSTCDVSIEFVGFEANQPMSVAVTNAADGLLIAAEYETELRIDADGLATTWNVQLPAEPGEVMYLIELTPETLSETYWAIATVNTPPG